MFQSGVLGRLLGDDTRFMIAVVAVAIVLGGPMVNGYAVLDELAFYIMLLPFLLRNGIFFWKRPQLVQEPRLQTLHRWLFLAFTAYLVIESVRGIWVLNDLRAIRFTALFGALGILAWTVRPALSSTVDRIEIARIILKAGIVYLLAYVVTGMIVEVFFQGWRLDLQGHFWSGTTAALFPVCVVAPTLLALNGKSDRVLFWTGFIVLLTAGFYYQSRLVWLTTLALIVVGLPTLGIRKAAIATGIFLAFITIFPWTQAGPLTPEIFKTVVGHNLTGFFRGQALANGDRFRVSIFGGATVMPEPIDEADIELLRQVDALIAKAKAEQDRLTTIQAMIEETGPTEELKRELDDINRHIAELTLKLNKASLLREKLNQSLANKDVGDIDRKLALLAALHYVSHNGPETLLFGTGYYTHRYKLRGAIHEVAERYGYTFPPIYNEVVRTAIFNGMLVDTGLVGMLLFGSLFVVTAVTLISNVGLANLLKPGPAIASLAGLGLNALSLNIGATYDNVLLYLALMPSGAILILYPKTQRPLVSQADVSTEWCQAANSFHPQPPFGSPHPI